MEVNKNNILMSQTKDIKDFAASEIMSNYGTVELEMHTFDERNIKEKDNNLDEKFSILHPTLFATKLKPSQMLARTPPKNDSAVEKDFITIEPRNSVLQEPKLLEFSELAKIKSIDMVK